MPSTSIKQRNFFQLVLQVKTHKMKRSDANQNVLDVVDSNMTLADIKDMASTTDKEIEQIEKDKKVNEVSHQLTPMNVNGMGEVQLPSNPGSSTEFSSQKTGSGDIPTIKKKKKKRMFLYIQDYDKFSANRNR